MEPMETPPSEPRKPSWRSSPRAQHILLALAAITGFAGERLARNTEENVVVAMTRVEKLAKLPTVAKLDQATAALVKDAQDAATPQEKETARAELEKINEWINLPTAQQMIETLIAILGEDEVYAKVPTQHVKFAGMFVKGTPTQYTTFGDDEGITFEAGK